jgi:RimJ/RimL family protein N-acetyltransferase
MSSAALSVREIERGDVPLIANYWLKSDPEFLKGMGVDLAKLPSRGDLTDMLSEQLHQSYDEKKSYCLIWLVDNKPTGHSNVNKIKYGEEAYMHLHFWDNSFRKQGYGTELVKMSLPLFFKNLRLKKICCEPYALNPAPNKTLEKVGFKFIKKHTTIPGYLNFEQEVNLWEIIEEPRGKSNDQR